MEYTELRPVSVCMFVSLYVFLSVLMLPLYDSHRMKLDECMHDDRSKMKELQMEKHRQIQVSECANYECCE